MNKTYDPDMGPFDEKALRSEVARIWGEHGAHVEVLDMLIRQRDELVALKNSGAPPQEADDATLVKECEGKLPVECTKYVRAKRGYSLKEAVYWCARHIPNYPVRP